MSFHFEHAVAAWRQRFAARGGFLPEDLDELERHLRDHAAHAQRAGADPESAFHAAVVAIGDMAGAEAEYKKVYRGKVQRRLGLMHELTATIAMFRNYLKTTLRGMVRRKGYAAINVVGLAVGLACCLVIFQYVASEYSYDRFHANEPSLYRVTTAMARPGEAMGAGAGAFTPHAMAPTFLNEIPEIERAARVHPEYGTAVISSAARPERITEGRRLFYVDPVFLQMFSFPLVAGDERTALTEPNTLLLTETAARTYFDDEDPIGKVLDVTVSGSVTGPYRVVGVLRDVPVTSSLQFDFLLPVADLISQGQYAEDTESGWSYNNFLTYLQLAPDADRAAVHAKMREVYLTHASDVFDFAAQRMRVAVRTQPLRDVHLNAEVEGPEGSVPEAFASGSYKTVYFFTVIGLVTLLIALVNYVNLATARAFDRAREVGVRKASGAQRKQLVVQFLVESAFTVAAAALLAVVLAAALMPVVNQLADARLTWALWLSPAFWAAFVVTLAACTVLAGLYPALVLSAFRPASALKGMLGNVTGGLRLRRTLVVVQFAASVVLIGGTAVVYDQLGYMRSLDLGLDLEQVLTVPAPRVLPEGADADAATLTLVEELRRLPAVRQAATSTTLPGEGFNWNGASIRKAEDDPGSSIRGVVTWVDTSFASLYGMELVAGDGYEAFVPPSDSGDAPFAVIPNETTVRSLGYTSAEEAVGQALDVGGNAATIVGVFRDVNWSSAHTERENILFGRTGAGDFISMRVSTADLPGTVAAVESIYARLFPGNVFRYSFADEAFDEQYRNDSRFATLFTLFAGLAIGIACLGLFGLASFTTRQRTKEIGVRKVLGASVPNLVGLLSRDFLKLVGVAIVIATPVAWWLMAKWLEGFAYHVDLGPGLFLLVGVIALLIALLSVAQQSLRAALADPSRSLRAE